MNQRNGHAAREYNGFAVPIVSYINAGDQDEMKIIGYRWSSSRNAVCWLCTLLSVGLLRLVLYWRPDWRLRCTCVVSALDQADFVLLEDQYNQKFVEKIKWQLPEDGGNLPIASKQSRHSEVLLSVRGCDQCTDSGLGEETTTPLINAPKSHKYFINKKMKFMWSTRYHRFEKLCGLDDGISCAHFHETKGLTELQRIERRALYGSNSIAVHVTPVVKLLFTQALNPFYIFQLFSCSLWFGDQYWYYASCILVISFISIAVQIYQTRSMQRALKSTIAPLELVTVCHAETGEFETVHSDMLVPGDVIEVPRQGCIMQCDAVLVTGNCIVNESMLTGESVPVTKTPIADHGHDVSTTSSKLPVEVATFNMKEHSRHVLFCGTHVIQTRYYGNQRVTAVVVRTGFSTAKGELVRSILFPKPVDFKFSQDGVKFVGFLALMALIGMIYTLVLMVKRGDNASLIVRRTLDLVTIIVPPALPAAMTIGIVFAQKRLRQLEIFCISPRSINLCGAVNVFCFDKTGTLTEDGLDMWGVVPARNEQFEKETKLVSELDCHEPLVVAMATCHSLTIIEGKIAGDPLDLKMFEASNWDLDEPGEDASKYDIIMPTIVRPKTPDIVAMSAGFDSSETLPYEVGILRQFTFSSKLQRMSVIARELSSDHFELYAKGSPEMIATLCDPKTVPENFHDVLMRYTEQGYRVIGLAHRSLQNLSYVKIQRARREQVECDLTFLGLLVLENRLKPETLPIIRTLREACIRTVMVTGDNMLTALSVARDCQMIGCNDKVIHVTVLPPTETHPPRIEYTHSAVPDSRFDDSSIDIETCGDMYFSITGKSWALLRRFFPDDVHKLVVRGIVFARFSPEQKQQLVEVLQEVGFYVGMCGDGANDCGALKTAHAGISLSEAEASVASPFTSKRPNIECVPKLIREGRAALVTSYGVFKYMAGYSMTQFLSVCLIYWIGANLTDWTFLYIDLPLLTTLGITFGYTEAYPQLDRKPPKISLIAVTPVLSIVLTLLVNMAAQVSMFLLVQAQPWFEPYSAEHAEDNKCYEVTAVFCTSAFQYIIMAIIFAKGAPYRKSIITNLPFMVNIILCTVLTAYIAVYPAKWIVWLMELQLAPSVSFRIIALGFATINFFVSYFVESFLIDGLVDGKLMNRWRRNVASKKLPYMRIEEELRRCTNWPPLSQHGGTLVDMMRLENACFQAETPDGSPAHDGSDPADATSDLARKNIFRSAASVAVEVEIDASRSTAPVEVPAYLRSLSAPASAASSRPPASVCLELDGRTSFASGVDDILPTPYDDGTIL